MGMKGPRRHYSNEAAAAALTDSRDKRPAKKTPAPPPPPAPEPAPAMIQLTPSPDAGEAVTLNQQAAMISVTDKASHVEALELLRGAKALKRKIEDHWMRITRNVDDLKRNLLDLKRRDLAPVEAAIASVNDQVIAYVDAENRRAQAEADERRREAEERAERDRQADLERREQEALKLEAASAELSKRETVFVDHYMQYGVAAHAARQAGFQNPSEAGARLLKSDKIQRAISAKLQANEIREQAARVAKQPVIPVATPKVESQIGKVAGTRMVTTYSAELVDLDELITAALSNPKLRKALTANMTFLNGEAKQLKEDFETTYPGMRLKKSQTVAG